MNRRNNFVPDYIDEHMHEDEIYQLRAKEQKAIARLDEADKLPVIERLKLVKRVLVDKGGKRGFGTDKALVKAVRVINGVIRTLKKPPAPEPP